MLKTERILKTEEALRRELETAGVLTMTGRDFTVMNIPCASHQSVLT